MESSIKVFLPFTKLRSATYSAVPNAVLVPLLDKTWDYGRYFQARWKDGESFINVEHDIVPTTEKLQELWDCPNDFCFAGYIYPGQPDRVDVAHLGCAKISRHLIENNPDIFDELPEWVNCETRIYDAAQPNQCYHGEVLHLHVDGNWPPDLEHLNRYDS